MEGIKERKRKRWRLAMSSSFAVFALVPLLAMQVTDEVAWTLSDFVFLAVMLGTCGTLYELTANASFNSAYRGAVAVALVAGFLLVVINGAVGIIGSEENDANLLFLGVIAIGLAGALWARFRPAGMANALFATACTQALVGAIAFLAGLGTEGNSWPWDVVGATVVFVALWLLSARLFQHAVRPRAKPEAVF